MRCAVLLLLLGCGLVEVATAASSEAFVLPAITGRAAWRPVPPSQPASHAKAQPRQQPPRGAAAGGAAAAGLIAAFAMVAVRLAGAGSTFAGATSPSTGSSVVQRLVAMCAHKKPTKKGRKIIILECVEQREMVRNGVPGAGGPRGGVSRYYTEKNVRNTPGRLELKKYNKYLGRHTVHRELK
uniref:50S ribosomal protein L33 n=1 Tax=Alexandrium monilatum TaxID=311494 RepID=A0A7S4WIC6_9DINO